MHHDQTSHGERGMEQIDTLFFDIGDTLATAKFTPAGKLKSLHPLPGVLQALSLLRAAGRRLGIISNTGDETFHSMRQALTDASLYQFLAEELLIFSAQVGMKKDSPEIFRLACQRAGLSPDRCMFVGEAGQERQFAAEAGMAVAETPADAVSALTPPPPSP
jgi:FMN phosphatase YigB (HAD superfamily)